MQIGITIFTILLVLAFVAMIVFAYIKEKRNLSKYTENLIFKKYNQKLDKISELFQNERLDKELDSCRFKIIEKEEKNDNMVYENIKTIDKLEDNFNLLKNIQKEFAHKGSVQDRIALLKKNIEIVNLKDYQAKPSLLKHKALLMFSERFKEIKLDEEVTTILSGTPCYQFGDVFMFLEKHILKIDREDVFAVEILDYDKFDVKVRFKDEEWIDFDGTYDLKDVIHKFPENADKDDPYVKEQVLQKSYVLSFQNGSMIYDVIHLETNKELQKKYDKLTTMLK